MWLAVGEGRVLPHRVIQGHRFSTIFKLQSPRWLCKGREEGGGSCRRIYGKPRSSVPYFHPYSVGQGSVTGPNWPAREPGKCSLSVTQEKWHRFLEYRTLPLSHMLFTLFSSEPSHIFSILPWCFPSVSDKSSPFQEAIIDLFLPVLFDCSLLWMNKPWNCLKHAS